MANQDRHVSFNAMHVARGKWHVIVKNPDKKAERQNLTYDPMVLNDMLQGEGFPLSAGLLISPLGTIPTFGTLRFEFPALIEPMGKHSRLDPYFLLPTLKQWGQPKLKDVRTVKAQFQLKKAANTLMLLVSKCEAARGKDNREIIQFLQNAGNSSADPLHFIVHTEPLLLEATEAKKEVIPEFSLEDFENVLKQKFSAKKGNTVMSATEETRGVHDWKLKDMPDPYGHYHTVMDLFQLENMPIVVLNVRDAEGALIHPAEYSKIFTTSLLVVAEVVMRLWTFVPDSKQEKGLRIYQTTLKSLRLLPNDGLGAAPLCQASGKNVNVKGKQKADSAPGNASPVKKSQKGTMGSM
ncbi:hypothetical protein BD769DRAFT_1389037 [Suillus cothurnatus]|nr:hypothetical protein BD769DRAFT_1389037 [Suillus cothurnatus]